MSGKTFIRLALLLGTPILIVLGIEAVARWGLFSLVEPGLGEEPARIRAYRDWVTGRETGLFAPRTYVGFTLNPASPGINSLGFRDGEFVRERAPGVTRIACLGASTTEGSMAEGGGSFPLHLGQLLARRGERAEVLNFGVSGWTSAESMINYGLTVQDFRPDVVVVHHAINDVRPRLWPDFRSDYSHYRRPWSEPEFGPVARFLVEHSDAYTALLLRDRKDWNLGALVNVPVSSLGEVDWKPPAPETAEPFLRNIRTIVHLARAGGAVPIVTTMPLAVGSPFFSNPFGRLIKLGVDEHNQLLRRLAEEEDVLLIDFAELWGAEPGIYSRHFIDHVHVTSEGNRLKALAIAELLEH